MKGNEHPLAADLDEILARTGDLWPRLQGARLFVTGGTGFIGIWLLESFLWANRKLNLGAEAVVLSRDPRSFAERYPRLARAGALRWHAGDVRTFTFPEGEFTHVLHAAGDATRGSRAAEPPETAEVIVDGTRRVLEFARARGAHQVLFVSSGAVYGRQPPGLAQLAETIAPCAEAMDLRSAYAAGKRAAEAVCAVYHREHGLEPKVARGFSFVGPHLPLAQGYAIGNFIRDALAGVPIRIEGDGLAWRSYLYAADVAAWLWTILVRARPCRPYNVGSGTAVTIAEAARLVAELSGQDLEVAIAKPAAPGAIGERYVPAVERARDELGLAAWTDLRESIRRTLAYHHLAQNPR